MRRLLPILAWIAWSAYFLTWPLDTVLSNFKNSYLDPYEGPVQTALFNFIGANNYLLLAATGLSAACLLQRYVSKSLARRPPAGSGFRSDQPTNDAAGATSGTQPDSDSRSKGRKMMFASIATLVVLYAISWWFRPFLNAPTILAGFWIGILLIALYRRPRQSAQRERNL